MKTTLVCAALVAGAVVATPPAAGETERTRTVYSPVYTVDRIYRSMQGPRSQEDVVLGDSRRRELYWITGYRAEMVGADRSAPRSQEYMCHSNLDFRVEPHREAFGWRAKSISNRLFTLSQGQLEITFPEGFGIPVLSDEPLSLTTQVLNLNDAEERSEVRHKVSIRYRRDGDAGTPMRPLFMVSANGLALLEGSDGYWGMPLADPELHGPGCMVGDQAGVRVLEDGFERKFTGHWTVPPGRQVNRTLVTRWMNLPFDTTAHYIAVHLHPFAQSLELVDLTSGESVFRAEAAQFTDRIGLMRVGHFASREGIALYKDHHYELVSEYDNTTVVDQDAMAVLYIYVLDREFEKPLL